MKINEIAQIPASFKCDGNVAHESVLKAFQILNKVKHLLEINTPAEVILEMIEEMEKPLSTNSPWEFPNSHD